MSEMMRPIPFARLVTMALDEYNKRGSIWGIRKEKFYRNNGNTIKLFGKELGSPVGPAAGPNSQLAQNIAASYLAGARFVELKTVQTMDGEDLRRCVPRPCIHTVDEGYNVEWSTELTVQQAFDEYVKAWFLCHLLMKEAEISAACDWTFNMSVGYSYDGIRSAKIDAYIEGLKDASATPVWQECSAWLSEHLGRFKNFTAADLAAIRPDVAPSITLSTLHGCPREEIEKIAAYLIEEKNIHTYVKCNPTLLGYAQARRILDSMGYAYIAFDEHHFNEDLQFDDAVAMLSRLRTRAAAKNLTFGVKITNTFPVDIKRGELPGAEMYMSGRALFPLSISVAKKIARSFDGSLPISFSGGADFFILRSILETGIRPVTVATTILKPGGYERLWQLATLAEEVLAQRSGEAKIDETKLAALAEKSHPAQKRHEKRYRHTASRKTASPLPLFDCFKAPCSGNAFAYGGAVSDGGCPVNQKIPEYLAAVAAGDFESAFKIIAADNTAPSITGTICNHECQNKCTRVDYDDAVEIRQAKLIAAQQAQNAHTATLKSAPLETDKSAGVVGAGPAGIAVAMFLRRSGVPVTVYEKRSKPYGIVDAVIPAFRIDADAVKRDYDLALKTGVEFVFNADERYSVDELKKKHDFVVIATGAWKAGEAPVKEGSEKIIDALTFLADSKASSLSLELGKTVAVVGGGDVAMDCARAAKRNKGVEKVTIVYRRTRDFMPAQDEEVSLALEDGVEIAELLAPQSFVGGTLVCEVMKLGDYEKVAAGTFGRRGIVGTGEKRTMHFDTVIGAVGARVDTTQFTENGLTVTAKGYPVLNAANESSVRDVYVAGDCKAGAATVVKAIADGKTIARDILYKLGIEGALFGTTAKKREITEAEIADLYLKKGVLAAKTDNADAAASVAYKDAVRCLNCNTLCEICVDVCPNRANKAVAASGFALPHQIVHFDRMCNECGNCAHFCPHAGSPYKDKFTVFNRADDFTMSENRGVLLDENGKAVLARLEGGIVTAAIPESYQKMTEALNG